MKWFLLSALLLTGCGAPSYPYSCGSPQLPLSAYSVAQAAVQTGTLVVKIVGPDGQPMPEAKFSLMLEFTGNGPRPKCPAGSVVDATGADGARRVERLKPGLYSIQVLEDAGEEVVQVTVHPNQTAEVTLMKR